MKKLDRLSHWLGMRDPAYIALRLLALLQRYGVTPGKAQRRVLQCVDTLAGYDCHPTFPTPGRVVAMNTAFCRELQAKGAELAVHGYDHVDFRSLTNHEAQSQLTRAIEAFHQAGVRVDGFRCPYLGYEHRLAEIVPTDALRYSSNRSVWWDVLPEGTNLENNSIFQGLQRFYNAESASQVVSTPLLDGDFLEIPLAIPDDLELLDGLKQGPAAVARAWTNILVETHRRGELFVLLFHPESFYLTGQALEEVVRRARALQPTVWVTQLRDVASWWREKATFRATTHADSSSLTIELSCSERATVLVRNLETPTSVHAWHGSYQVLDGRTLRVTGDRLPFLGVAASADPAVVSFLQQQGYIVQQTDEASACHLYLDLATLSTLNTQVKLVEHIESSTSPLVRFWRWPEECLSALCITGDLDAVSLVDYAARIFTL